MKLEPTNRLVWLIFAILIAFHTVPFLGQTEPKVFPDEFIYLSQAKFLAGKSPTPQVRPFMVSDTKYELARLPADQSFPYAHFGYSLLVIPAYMFTDKSGYSYKAVIAINSVLMSSLFVILYFWVQQISNLSRAKAIIAALLASLYPAYNLQTHIGWSENALIPFFALSVFLLTIYLKQGKPWLLIGFSLVAGYLYTLHPRGIAGSIAAIICLFLLAALDKEKRNLGLLGVVFIVLILVTTRYAAGLLSELMGAVSHEGTVFRNLRDLIGLNFLLITAGHVLYLILGTVGVFVLGLAFFGQKICRSFGGIEKKRKAELDDGALVYVFILLSSFLLFSLGVIFLTRDMGSYNYAIDRYLYGRYNEAFLSVYLVGGLVFLFDSGNFKKPRIYNVSFLILMFICASFIWFLDYFLADFRAMRSLHSPALFPWYLMSFGFDGWVKLTGIFVGPLLWIWIMYQSRLKVVKRTFIIIGCYFLGITASMLIYQSPV